MMGPDPPQLGGRSDDFDQKLREERPGISIQLHPSPTYQHWLDSQEGGLQTLGNDQLRTKELFISRHPVVREAQHGEIRFASGAQLAEDSNGDGENDASNLAGWWSTADSRRSARQGYIGDGQFAAYRSRHITQPSRKSERYAAGYKLAIFRMWKRRLLRRRLNRHGMADSQ
ncbi:hypothetical protein CERZMDRAFT_101250 [Cercospora zeae-maydis SCOH1-5]|uniref:Uncharacterized protein n=1 Tax=Cercospora zeae-maydis SCOH1-5 TaxID=717836 RepID=A0A6A6F798_9PEZI|nr:hypothetical protein CERZMDRAFT_101250 [Cercospora zeae-maydis SCOH1-5]